MSPAPVRVGVVGAGWWATSHHLPALAGHPGARLTGVVDRDPDRAAEAAAAFGTTSYPDLAVLLADVDAVVVATPHDTHHSVVMACLARGLHVLVEKPLALSFADAAAMARAADDAGVHLVVGYTHQFEDVAAFVRDAVRHRIGPLLQVTVEYSSRAARLYSGGTYGAEHGGGQARTQLTHALGMLCWVTGEEITTVAAFTEGHGHGVDVDDAAILRLSGGATATACSSGRTPDGVPVRQHIRYLGADGAIDHDLFRGEAVLFRADGTRVAREHSQHEPPYRAGEPARRFVDLIAGQGENPAPPGPAVAAVAAVEAILESARRGAYVRPSQMRCDHTR
ncbi:Gfo/Idh/MocA family protein [Jiangella rhizosphaerae]|uniref:Gfo/Idh/MocA family protein n=1 Tax=Jiangella rhizosphaerae TaxID=2293569 RepID=UPI0013143678|nr:Gfo/Idh/MocA family oxidoreductase [Jiangella rhizosphaerae]